jgi:hypothetical protein
MTSLTYQWLPLDTKIKRPVGRPRTRTRPRKEYQRAHYYLKRYGNTDRLNPEFVKPKQTRQPRAEVEIEFYYLPALSEDDYLS